MSRWLHRFVLATALTLLPASPAFADDLFNLSAVSSSTATSAGGSSVIGLVNDLVNTQDKFSSLSNQTFNSKLTYAGLKDAIQLNQSFDGNGNRVINLKVPSTGLNKTFSSANGDLQKQVEDFLKKDGLAALSDFQATVSRETVAGVMDGNPLALDALLTDTGFYQFGMQREPYLMHGEPFDGREMGFGETRFYAQGGIVRAGGQDGYFADASIGSVAHFGDRVSLAFTAPFRWTQLHGADIFMGGLVVGLPITLLPGGYSNSVTWQITPAAHGGAVGSADFASGGLIYGGQVVSSLSYTFRGLTFTLANQAAYYRGANISVGDYDFDTQLDQWMFKNGIQVSKAWNYFFIDAGAAWTNYLHDTYVDGYLSPTFGLGWRFGRGRASGFRVGYTGNFGEHYNTNAVNLLLFFTN